MRKGHHDSNTEDNQTTGASLLALAADHVGEQYVLGTVAPKDCGSWKGPWDCAEFASWLVYQTIGSLYGCTNDAAQPRTANAYTGSWAHDAESLGKKISVEQAASTKGAFVLRIAKSEQKYGHIVISDGMGGTVEARSSKAGVTRATLASRVWDFGILIPGISYQEGIRLLVPAPMNIVYRVTIPYMADGTVLKIQDALKVNGLGACMQNGSYDEYTAASVLAFQLQHQLTPDGEVGPETAGALGIEL